MMAYLPYVVTVSVMFLMLGVGLTIDFREILRVARNVGLVGRGILANFLIVPVLIYLSLLWLPFSPGIKMGILLMAAAPVAPMTPPFVEGAKGDMPYAVGLMAIVAILSIVLVPLIILLAVPESVGGVDLDPLQIIKTLLTAQLIPISIGMAIRSRSRQWTRTLLKFVPMVGKIGLFVGVGLILLAQAKQILTMGVLPHVVMLLMVAGCLLIGDRILIGKTEGERRSLAISTAIRNVPLAFLIASENFPGTVVAPVTLVFGTYTMIAAIVYGKLKIRRESQR